MGKYVAYWFEALRTQVVVAQHAVQATCKQLSFTG